MLYTLKVELATRHGLTQADLRARIQRALWALELDSVPTEHDPSIVVGAWWLDTPSEQGISSKDAIRESRARAARLAEAWAKDAANAEAADPNSPEAQRRARAALTGPGIPYYPGGRPDDHAPRVEDCDCGEPGAQ